MHWSRNLQYFTSYHIAFGYQILRVVVTKYVNYQSETLCISSAPAKKFTHLTFRRLRVLHMPAERTQHVLVSSMRVKLVEKIMSYLIQFINENIGYCFFSNGGNNSHFKHIISTLFIIPTELITSSDLKQISKIDLFMVQFDSLINYFFKEIFDSVKQ